MEIIYSSKYIRILGKVYYITLPSILYYFAKYIILLCQVYYITDSITCKCSIRLMNKPVSDIGYGQIVHCRFFSALV